MDTANALTPQPDDDEIRDNATFAALLDAMARPGTIGALPRPGLAPVIAALIDMECTAFSDQPDLAAAIAGTGARVAGVDAAGYAFTSADAATGALRCLPAGSALYPDRGATLAVTAPLGTGTRLRLTGPGIETTAQVAVGLPADFWTLRAARCRYPQGVDLIVIDGARVMALPRSTAAEVL